MEYAPDAARYELTWDALSSETLEMRRRFLSGTGSTTTSPRTRLPPLLRLHSAVSPADGSGRLSALFGDVFLLRDEYGDGSGLRPSGNAGTGGIAPFRSHPALSSGLMRTIWFPLIRRSFQ